MSSPLVDPSIPEYLYFVDSTVAGALTAAFGGGEFNFVDLVSGIPFQCQTMVIRHDGGVDIEFSMDGTAVQGRLTAADGRISMDNFRARKIYLRGLAAAFRLWAW